MYTQDQMKRALESAINAEGLDAQLNRSDFEVNDKLYPRFYDKLYALETKRRVLELLDNPEAMAMLDRIVESRLDNTISYERDTVKDVVVGGFRDMMSMWV